MIPYPLAVRALAGLAVAAACFGAGWAVNGWRLGASIAQERADEARRALRVAETAGAERDALAGDLARVDADAIRNLRRLTDENDDLRARVAAGTVRVRVRGAACPAHVPASASGSGVDSGAGTELTPTAGQDILDLRADAIRVGAKLSACQDALRAITQQGGG